MTDDQLDKYWKRVSELRALQCEQIRQIGLKKRERDELEAELVQLDREYQVTDRELGLVLEQMRLDGLLDSG